MNPLAIALGVGVAGLVLAFGGKTALRRTLRRARDDHAKRPALWNRFYALDWGETSTNNYGFAPAEGEHPQRFQHQMYRELLKLLKAKRPLQAGMTLLEVSCGRGGGGVGFWGTDGASANSAPRARRSRQAPGAVESLLRARLGRDDDQQLRLCAGRGPAPAALPAPDVPRAAETAAGKAAAWTNSLLSWPIRSFKSNS